jgi:3-oxoacyl-[acyl-carrier protein] reductase
MFPGVIMKKKIKGFIRCLIRLIKKKEMVPIPTPVNGKRLLEGKIALITGGSGGIGFAVARSFLESGCKVIIAGTNKTKLEKCCSQLGGEVRYIILNVLDVTTIPGKIASAAERFSEKRIDILVNAAGVLNRSDFFDTTEEEYDSIMGVNAKGTYFMCQAISKFMIENKIKGHILNVTSASALRPAWTPYQMSKWAVRGFTLGLADTLLPHGIIVNAIAPGPVATPMLGKQEGDSIHMPNNPSGRYAMPSEIAALATFMVSDMGNLIVGDTFYITGGSGTISLHS